MAVVPRNTHMGHFIEFVCPDCEKTFYLRASEPVAMREHVSA